MNKTPEEWHFHYVCQHFSKDNSVGWIDPEGVIHPTGLHGHLQFFIGGTWDNIPGLDDCLLSPAREYSERQQEDWSDLYRSGERRWHEFCELPFSPEWDQERDAYDAIYSAGWGRIGRFKGIVEIDSYEEFGDSLRAAVSDVLAVLECECTSSFAERLRPAQP